MLCLCWFLFWGLLAEGPNRVSGIIISAEYDFSKERFLHMHFCCDSLSEGSELEADLLSIKTRDQPELTYRGQHGRNLQ